MPSGIDHAMNSPQTAIGKGTVGEPTPAPKGKNGLCFKVALFFDGTMNNRTNTEVRISQPGILQVTEGGAGSSYGNYYSNVAIMEYMNLRKKNVRHEVSVYVEGIGTVNFSEEKKKAGVPDALNGADNRQGNAFGSGPTGIRDKVTKGIVELRYKIGQAYNPKNQFVQKIIIDVVGFSRGAAAARHFVSRRDEVQQPLYKQSAPALVINFVGLFETVSSFDEGGEDMSGIVGNGLVGKTEGVFDDDVKQLGLTLGAIPKRVVHLTADDEHRENFSLTTINSSLAAHVGFELGLPGVHSDIGGGYVEAGQGALNLEVKRIGDPEEKRRLIAEGWYTDGTNGTKNQFVPSGPESPSVVPRKIGYGKYSVETPAIPQYHLTKWESAVRSITTEYQFVPLYLMLGLATKQGSDGAHEALELESLGMAKNAGYRVPQPLVALRDYFAAYVCANAGRTTRQHVHCRTIAERNVLRNKYLHRSTNRPTDGGEAYLANASASNDTRVIIDDTKLVDKLHKRAIDRTKKIPAQVEEVWDGGRKKTGRIVG